MYFPSFIAMFLFHRSEALSAKALEILDLYEMKSMQAIYSSRELLIAEPISETEFLLSLFNHESEMTAIDSAKYLDDCKHGTDTQI